MTRRNVGLPAVILAAAIVLYGVVVSEALAQVPADSSAAAVTSPPAEPASQLRSIESRVDGLFATFNSVVGSVIFFPVPLWFGESAPRVPLVVLWLVFAAVFLTIRMGFINIRGFRHAITVTMGKYDRKEDAGEVNHFQALATALSATVGMGNIAGVATAIGLGGPGACFWLVVAGALGMTSKFSECTLALMYRETRPDGRVMGGAMFYLTRGLKDIGLGPLGLVLGYAFVVLCIGASLAGGNSYQVNQSLGAISQTIPFLKTYPWVYGLLMTFMTGIVILGGLRWIARVAELIVPFMCGLYILMSLYILGINIAHIPMALVNIVSQAFHPQAVYGGMVAVLVVGFQRASFSNEAGVGSAAIAHSAAKTPYPAREGVVALLEPFIDTVVVCTMTALVMVITESYDRGDPELARLIADRNGAAITSRAFGSQVPIFAYGLSLIVFLFAYSTQISWSYYGERCWAFLFGDGASVWFRILFLVFTFLGSIVTATQMLEFGDAMILGMAFPNLIGVILLSGKIRAQLDSYWTMYKSGDFDRPALPQA